MCGRKSHTLSIYLFHTYIFFLSVLVYTRRSRIRRILVAVLYDTISKSTVALERFAPFANFLPCLDLKLLGKAGARRNDWTEARVGDLVVALVVAAAGRRVAADAGAAVLRRLLSHLQEVLL